MIIIKEKTLERIKDWEDSSIYVLADFDKTITSGNSESSWSILSKNNIMPKEYDEEAVLAGFGDTSNDNEMISVAGLGVCLLNGSDDTKALANDITDLTCEEEGFADYVEKHIL